MRPPGTKPRGDALGQLFVEETLGTEGKERVLQMVHGLERALEERAACFELQYAGYTALADVKVNGKLTLGERSTPACWPFSCPADAPMVRKDPCRVW